MFISILIFIFIFLLFTLAFACWSFSSYFRFKAKLFKIFLLSWVWPVEFASAVSNRFWVVMVSFSFVSRYLLNSSLISLLTYSLFSNMLCSLHVFVCFSVFFLVSDFWFHTIVVGEDAWYDFNLLKFIETCFMSEHVVYPRKCSVCTKQCIFCCFWIKCPKNTN